jgi:hypothetical protein
MPLTTKAEALQALLHNKTPDNANYEDFVSNFNEENVFSFIVNKNNIDMVSLVREINEKGFIIIDVQDREKERLFIRVKEVV